MFIVLTPRHRLCEDVVCNAAAGAGFIFSNNLQFCYHRLYKARQVCSSSNLVSTGGLKRFHYYVSQSADKQHCIAKSGVGHGSWKFIVLSKFSVNWLNASRKIQPIYGLFIILTPRHRLCDDVIRHWYETEKKSKNFSFF